MCALTKKALLRLLTGILLVILGFSSVASLFNPIARFIVLLSDPASGFWSYTLDAKLDSESIVLPGLRGKVEVYYDVNGVPHVIAEYEEDAFRVIGWLHARDRFWQMDVMRRIGYGNLSALVGEAALGVDKFMRTLGYHVAVRESFRLVEELAREGDTWAQRALRALRAYAEGVNAWLEQTLREDRVPVEYRILGARPEPWRPEDSMAVAYVIIHGLGFKESDAKIALLAAAKGSWVLSLFLDVRDWLSNATIAGTEWRNYIDVFTDYMFRPAVPLAKPEDVIVLSDVHVVPERLSELIGLSSDFSEPQQLRILSLILSGVFSNNWVIHGSRSATGYPLLANDPHLQLSVPPVWYEMSVEIKETKLWVHGVAFPGVPFIIIGRNQYVAFGYTNSMIDVVDFYYYVWSGDKYYYMGEWRNANTRLERILVRDPMGNYRVIEHRVLETVHGPVLEYKGLRMAVKTTTTMPSPIMVWAYRVMNARSVYDVLEAQQYFYAPIQNAIAADVEGNILYSPTGLIPVRTRLPILVLEAPEGTRLVVNTGFYPFNGSRGEGEWLGFMPFSEIPRLLNPPKGYVATANNYIAANYSYHGAPHNLQLYVCDRYRFQRIVELLEEKLANGAGLADMAEIQIDTVSLAARNFISLFRAIAPEKTFVFKGWDFNMLVDDYRPTIAFEWIRTVHDTLWSPVFEAAGLEPDYGCSGVRLELTEYMLREALEGNTWYLEKLGWSDIVGLVTQTYSKTMNKLRELYGTNDYREWLWGRKHQYAATHLLGGVIPWLNYEPLPAPGDPYTVNPSPETRLGEGVRAGPSVRFVADLDPNARVLALFQMPGGNSGNPFSKYYDNQYEPWVRGLYHSAVPGKPRVIVAQLVFTPP